jgi:ABC-type multidrug transport system fused ATPase/permease subunit
MIRLNVQTRQLLDSSNLTLRQRLGIMLRLQRYIVPYIDKVILRVLAALLLSFLITVPALLMPYVIDDALPNKDIGLLVKLTLIGIGAYIIIRILGIIAGTERVDSSGAPSNLMASYMIPRIAVTIKMDFVRHMQKLSVGFFDTRPVGEHMFRSTLDCDDAAFIASELIPKTAAVVQRIAVLLFVLQGFGMWLLYPLVGYLIFFFVAKHLIATAIRRWDRRFRVETQRLDAVTREVLFPWKLVKAYTLESLARTWYGTQATRSVRAVFMRAVLLRFDSYFSFVLLMVFVTILGVYTGWLVILGDLTLGEHAAIAGLMTMVIRPFEDMISTIQLFRQKLVPAERLLETLAIEPAIQDPAEPKSLGQVRGAIELQDVHFEYEDNHPVLKGISMQAEPGQKIAIVGPSGAGKSTLLSLLVRFYDPQKGTIKLDGIDLRDVQQDELRHNLAYVSQNINTFTESIRRNILYSNPTATEEEVFYAGEIARVDEYALEMPEGYDTILGEGGSISGGQKQRLCLARALVRDAPVLLLDEATSALDPVTEKEVVEAIDSEFANHTRIVVAHNMLNARNADHIYVLDEGEIVDEGTHANLIAKPGLYRKLWGLED